jgi:hypothetical protein
VDHGPAIEAVRACNLDKNDNGRGSSAPLRHSCDFGVEYVELGILKSLAARLPDGYTLFHRVDWTCAELRRDSHGELDIVVVNSAGDMAVLEVKFRINATRQIEAVDSRESECPV